MEKNFVVYKSSAGSGKTFTLVKEYLKICLSSNEPLKFREILAITFTNKAAAEMKSRIIGTLKELVFSVPDQHPMGAILLNEINIGKDEFCRRASNVLKSILHNYADFSVSTIDQFTYRLIRSFARELHIPGNFEVEMDADNLLRKVIALLIDKVGKDENISKLLIKYTQTRTEEEKYYDIENEIKEYSKKLLGEVGGNHLLKIKKLDIPYFIEMNKEYRKQNAAYQKKLGNLASEALELINSHGIEYSSFKSSYVPNWLEKILNNEIKFYTYIEKLVKAYDTQAFYPQKTPVGVKTAIDSISERLGSIFNQMQDLFEKENILFNTRKGALKSIYPLALLNEIEKLIEEIKKEESIIHISDFNKKISAVVDKEPVPFIYERIGEKYKHFMLDEFQDTSVLQYQNLLPLLDNSLSENQYNMLVGDGKQAIYRWRGGEVEQFSEMPDHVHPNLSENQLYLERQQVLNHHYREENLMTNFRSSETVVDFNNRFFGKLQDLVPPRIQQIYRNNRQDVKDKGKVGYIYIGFLEKDEYQERMVQKVYEDVRECLSEGFQYSDIAILCRTKDKASIIADFLSSSGIPIISSESLLLSKSQEVSFLIFCLKYIFNPEDEAAKSYIVEYICNRNSLDFHSNIENCGKTAHFKQFIHKNTDGFSFDTLADHSFYELCETLIRAFSLNKEYDVYIESFLEQVYQFNIRINTGLSSFLEWWTDKCKDIFIDAPENMDAVRIMTVHKSKGLEFPVVIYPFADREIYRKPNDVWVQVKQRLSPSPESMIISSNLKDSVYQDEVDQEQEKILMDEINVNYVAFTRAVDRLYIYTRRLPKNEGNTLTSTSKIIHAALQTFQEFNPAESQFEMGQKIPKTAAEKKSDPPDLPEFISNDWREKLSVSLEAPLEWNDRQELSPMDYGSMVHKLLSEISSKTDLDAVVDDFRNKGLLSAEESESIRRELEEILNETNISGFFEEGKTIKTEEAILTPEGKTYRPDRVIFHDDSIDVVDFKSGAKEEVHKEQILNYAQLITAIENKATKAYLIYLNTREVIEL